MVDTVMLEPQNERSSGSVVSILRDENDALVPLASITALLLTLYEPTTQGVIRRAQNVLNANNVTVGVADGKVTWAVQPSDMAMVTGKSSETHVAQFTAKWASGAKEKTWQIILPVVNLPLYP